MSDMPTAPYPLAWPEGRPRARARIKSSFKTQMPQAVKNVQDSLRLFAADSGLKLSDLVVTSNTSLFDHKPADPGVAVWFRWDGAARCIAVDRYLLVQENLQAIHHVLEARRVELRHAGIEMARAAFSGFRAALPPPDRPNWRAALGLDAVAPVTREAIVAAWKARHRTSTEAERLALNMARDQALKDLGE